MVRFKNRYLLIQVHPVNTSSQLEFASPSTIASMIRSSVEDNFGVAVASKINPSLSIKFASLDSLLLIVRCQREAVKEVWSSVTFMTAFPGKNCSGVSCIWQVIGVSGTIRCSQVNAIKSHKKAIDRVLSATELSMEQRQDIEAALVTVEQTIKRLEP